MRRISKVKPKEISMCFEGANRRIIALYKSASSKLAKGGPGSGPHKGEGGESRTAQRGNGQPNAKKEARIAASEAERASRGATNNKDHWAAAKAHEAASSAQMKAGNSNGAGYHRAQAAMHREKGDAMSKSARLAKGGPGSGPRKGGGGDHSEDRAAIDAKARADFRDAHDRSLAEHQRKQGEAAAKPDAPAKKPKLTTAEKQDRYDKAEDKADRLTARAEKKNTAEAHERAMDAHERALKYSMTDDNREYHEEQSASHEEWLNQNEGEDDDMEKSSESSRLAKGGPGSGPRKGEGSGPKNWRGQDLKPAMDASAAAKQASKDAKKSNTPESHQAAADAHQNARKEAVKTSDYQTAGEHRRAAERHESLIGKLVEAAVNVKKSRQGNQPMNIEDAISNLDPEIHAKLTTLAKSVDATDGRGYSPQAASIVKAVGRLLAPFSEELTLGDLQSIGKAAGLGSNVKDPDDEDDEEQDGDENDNVAPGLKKSAKSDDEGDGDDEDEDEWDDEDEEDEEDEDEDLEEDAKKSARRDVALNSGIADNLEKSASDDSDEDEDEEEDEDDGEAEGDKPPPFGRAKGAKAKGEKMSKTASGTSESARFAALEKSHKALIEQNKAMSDEIKKSRKDLDDERDFRQLEAIKKSIREEYPALGLDADKFAPMLKTARDAEDQAQYDALRETLAKCNKQVASAQAAGGIFESIGKSSGAQAAQGGGDWSARIEQAVDEEMKKSGRGKHRAVVYDEFVQTAEGRDMLMKHRQERGN